MRIALRLNLAGGNAETCPISEMSRGLQRIYNRTARRFSAHSDLEIGTGKIVPKLHARVTVNGREFGDVEQMPPEYRRFYEEILTRALPVQRAVDIVARAERCNFIMRTITLGVIAAGCAAAIVYLWLHGYYG
ncbi:MAG: hypothetical protein ACXV97_11175 [Chthoniobacterales bacterium]